jgi:hypothetical protein
MADKDWREQWEDASGSELEELRALPLDELQHRIAKRRLGSYYVIWDAIAARRDLAAVGWRLFDFLESSADYLNRYHCARVLLALLDCRDFEPADLSAEQRNPRQNLAAVQRLPQNALVASVPIRDSRRRLSTRRRRAHSRAAGRRRG